LNPWETKLVEHPKEWKWSSFEATAGLNKPLPFLTTDWLLEIFGSDIRRARGNYVKFVEADMDGKRSKLEYKYPLKNIANYLNMDPNYLCSILKKLET